MGRWSSRIQNLSRQPAVFPNIFHSHPQQRERHHQTISALDLSSHELTKCVRVAEKNWIQVRTAPRLKNFLVRWQFVVGPQTVSLLSFRPAKVVTFYKEIFWAWQYFLRYLWIFTLLMHLRELIQPYLFRPRFGKTVLLSLCHCFMLYDLHIFP